MSLTEVMQGQQLDNFSNLPKDIIDIILSLVPLRDAVKTSILSKRWRLHWTRSQSLVLDWDFFYEILDHGPENDMFDAASYVSMVDSILSSHTGPVREFYLHVPHFGLKPVLHPNAINNWILSVSQRGVQNLTLELDDAHPLPSSLFQCMTLNHLCLRFVQLALPAQNFRKLSSLVSLELVCAELSIKMVTSIIENCPLLERLSLDQLGYDAEDDLLVLTAPKLEHLSIQYLVNIFFSLKNNPSVSTLSIQRTGEIIEEEYTKESQDITDFFRAVPNIENINLHSDVLTKWAKKNVPERLSALLEKHMSLVINELDMSSHEQLRSLFCLIKSSPKLQTLDILTSTSQNVEAQDTVDYLESQVTQTENLWSLRIVKLTHLKGGKAEMIFIETILSLCPKMVKLYLSISNHISFEEEYRMMKNVIRFRRASTQAKVIYLKLE